MSLKNIVISVFSNILASWNQLLKNRILNKQMLFIPGMTKKQMKKAKNH